MPFNLGGPELIIVLVIVLIVFGAGKLPNVMRDFGRGVKEFKKAQTEEEIAAEAAAANQATSPTLSSNAPSSSPNATSAPPATNGQTSRTAEPAPRA
jgi:sec-independent protein translocase protein TatA